MEMKTTQRYVGNPEHNAGCSACCVQCWEALQTQKTVSSKPRFADYVR